MTESNHQGSTTQAGFFVPGQGAAQGSPTPDEDRTAEIKIEVLANADVEVVEALEVDDPTPVGSRAFDESTIGRKLPEAESEFRHTVPGAGAAAPGIAAPSNNPSLTVAELDAAPVTNRPAFGPPATPSSATGAPTWRQLPPRPPRASQPPATPEVVSKNGSIVVDLPPQELHPDEGIRSFLEALDAARPAEADFFGRQDQVVTEILPAVPEPAKAPLDDPSSDDRRSQRRVIFAVIGVLMTMFLAVTSIQLGARLTGGEKHGLGGVLADLITNQTRPPRVPSRSVPVVVATVRRTPPTKLVVAQRPVQAPVLRPVSPPRAPTPQPPPIVPIIAVRPTAPPTPPPSAVVPNALPVPTTAVPHCRLSGSFASEAEATRLGYTDVWLFPGQARDPNTRVCLPRNAPSR